jgi:c-di-GMP-binding flagellar brake protein YcgR
MALLQQGQHGWLRAEGLRWPMEILMVSGDTIGIDIAAAPLMAPGMATDLEFATMDGLAFYHAQVVSPPDAEDNGMIVQRASSATYAQRRRSWRVALEMPVLSRLQDDAQVFEAKVMNVCAEGALIETCAKLELCDRIEMVLPFAQSTAHHVTAQVVRVQPGKSRPTPETCYGLVFVAVPPEIKRALTMFLWKRLRELYPKEIAALWPGTRNRCPAAQAVESGV